MAYLYAAKIIINIIFATMNKKIMYFLLLKSVNSRN